MEKKDTRGIHNTLKRCTRSQVTQTLPIDSDSNGLREFTQLIHHDSVANICGGDTMMNDSDDDEMMRDQGTLKFSLTMMMTMMMVNVVVMFNLSSNMRIYWLYKAKMMYSLLKEKPIYP